MRETIAGDRVPTAPAPSAAVRETLAATRAAAPWRSQLRWGEHCSECSYPKCYASCSFYDPRPDLKCRRFEAGMERVEGEAGAMRVRFRRWGKLEARGPAALRPAAAAEALERRDLQVCAALAAAPTGFWASNHLAWRWNERKRARATAASSDPAPAPTHFVVEAWSNDGRPHDFTLTFLETGSGRMFQGRFTATSAPGRFTFPHAAVAAAVDLAADHLIQVEVTGEPDGGADVGFGLMDWAALELPAAAPSVAGGPAKVLVWDLDETLWTGTLAEDGAEGVVPRPEAVEAVRALDARGVLLSVASKNDEAEALAALERHGLRDYFLAPQVGWGPKSEAVARIAAALDLHLDSFVFVDDQPFERAEVAAAHPSVRTLAHTQVAGLAAHPWFDRPVTAESGRRRALYQAEAGRGAAAQAAGSDYLAFLRGSGIVLDVAPLGPAEVARVHELSQRTNQLNFTGAKLSRTETERLAAPDPDRARLTLRCLDRYGDYGLIGFADLDLLRGELDLFFMSCRVQRKRVEHAAFAHMAALLAARGHVEFAALHRPTDRNRAAALLLADLGFAPGEADAQGRVRHARPLDAPFAESDVVAVRAAAPAARAA